MEFSENCNVNENSGWLLENEVVNYFCLWQLIPLIVIFVVGDMKLSGIVLTSF